MIASNAMTTVGFTVGGTPQGGGVAQQGYLTEFDHCIISNNASVDTAGGAAGIAAAQATQTLPRGFDSGTGGSGSAYPFNSAATHLWQWHYDSAQFPATGPMLSTEIYVRTLTLPQAEQALARALLDAIY